MVLLLFFICIGASMVQASAASKTFTYTVSEVEPAGDKKGITYAASQTLSITVTDEGNGSLSVVLAALDIH